MTARMLLTPSDWQWWFGVSGAEADRLVSVQRALAEAGIDCCPETVLGMSRTVLADGLAPHRLRRLADLWDLAPASTVAAHHAWPPEGDPNPGPWHGDEIDERSLHASRCRRRPTRGGGR